MKWSKRGVIYRETLGEILNILAKEDNMTNGDVIKTVFPNLEWLRGGKDVDYYYLDSDTSYTPKLSTFKSWWNAPYKREVEE